MPGQAVTLEFSGGRAAVDERGAVALGVDGLPGTVRLALHASALSPVMVDDEVIEHEGGVAGLEVAQRVSVAEHCQLRWVVDVPEDAVGAGLDLDLTVGEGQSAWLWPSGADGFVAVLPERGSGPVLALHAVQAELRLAGGSPETGRPVSAPAGAVPVSPGGLRVRLTAPDLAPGRQVVIVRVLAMPALITVATLLPAWYEPLTLDAGDAWVAPLADLGVDCEPPVTLDFTEDASEVQLTAPPGRHRVGVHGRRGVTDLVLDVAAPMGDVLAEVAEQQQRQGEFDGAGAFVLHRAVESGVLHRTQSVEDALDRFDWSAKPGPLAVAFGSERALVDGEHEMARVALRRCSRLPSAAGRPRVRSLVWLAASALGVSADPPELDDGDPRLEGLEAALALGRRSQSSTDRLAGAINRLGAALPGSPVGLGMTEQALLVGLLESCPEDWPEAPLAGFTAQATRCRILASYAAGELTDPTPLAWLLLYG